LEEATLNPVSDWKVRELRTFSWIIF